jgi:tetratricopeptide (TPR) repeat protein
MIRTGVRNYEWANPERFYYADMKVAGMSVQMLNNLSLYLTEIGETDRAIKALEVIIAATDTSPEPHDNLARIYVDLGETQKAKTHFLRALEIDAFNLNALMGLRALYDSRGEIAESMKVEQQIRAIEREEKLSR